MHHGNVVVRPGLRRVIVRQEKRNWLSIVKFSFDLGLSSQISYSCIICLAAFNLIRFPHNK
jgi:hypothetical protein